MTNCPPSSFPPFISPCLGLQVGWAGLGWAGLGWAGLGWAGLGWAGLGWAGLGWGSILLQFTIES